MKKKWVICLCLMLIGCQGKSSVEKNKNDLLWTGKYQNGNVELKIVEENDYIQGFQYTFALNGKEIQDYANFDSDVQATSAVSEDGYTLTFTLKQDKVIIEEMNGPSYLGTELSGEYMKE